MLLHRKLKTFMRMHGIERRLILEAMLMLALARLFMSTVPFRRIAPWLALAPETAVGDETLVALVRSAVTIAAYNLPWKAVCLPQAMAAKAMLARRGCGSSFHLGAHYDGRGRLVAHAWLEAGGTVIFGAQGIPQMARLVRFG